MESDASRRSSASRWPKNAVRIRSCFVLRLGILVRHVFKLHHVPERCKLVAIGLAAEEDRQCLKLMLLQLLLFHRIHADVAVVDRLSLFPKRNHLRFACDAVEVVSVGSLDVFESCGRALPSPRHVRHSRILTDGDETRLKRIHSVTELIQRDRM